MPYSARLLFAAIIALSPAASLVRDIAAPAALLAQTPAFELPDTVPSGTDLTIQRSPHMGATAQDEAVAVVATAVATDAAEATAAEVDGAAGDADAATTEADRGSLGWLWWLLPIAGVIALVWILTRGKSSNNPTVERGAPAAGAAPPLDTPPGPASTVDAEATQTTTADTAPDRSTSVEPTAVAETEAAHPPIEELPPPAPAPAPIPEAEPPTSIDDVAPEPTPTPATNGATPRVEPPSISEPDGVASRPNNAGVAPPTADDTPTVPDVAPTPMSGSAISTAAGAAGLAAGAAASMASTEDQSAIEASKYNVVGRPADGDIDLSTLDDGLPPLPDGYDESRIVLMPRDPQWAYAYWDTPNSHKEQLRNQGGERLALRLYDVTDIDLSHQAPHSMQQFDCDELAREWYMQIPVSDRDYMVEIGYLAGDGRWLVLAQSNTVRIPPVFPSDWAEEHFMTVGWEENLQGKTLMTLVDPRFAAPGDAALHDQMFALSQASELQRVSGSIFGSMQHVPGSAVPQQSISSYVFPSGVGMGPGAPGFPGLNMSGVNVSGLTMSGVGFSASAPPIRPRKFWLIADAELIVYGATEPDATVTVGGTPIQLAPDGTFRFQTAFPDGQIEYPIMGVAADGEQSRSIHMKFERRTPERRTNTKEEAQEEWPEGRGELE